MTTTEVTLEMLRAEAGRVLGHKIVIENNGVNGHWFCAVPAGPSEIRMTSSSKQKARRLVLQVLQGLPSRDPA